MNKKTDQFSYLKIFRHGDKIAKYQSAETPFPISVDLSASNFCNHKCIWCVYSKFLNQSKDILEKDILFRLIVDLDNIGVKGINFTGGGEPLTNKFTVDAMEKAYSLGMDVGLITNGSLLDKESIRRLVKITKYIRISLDAGTPETYSKLHQTNIKEFEKVLSNIEYMGMSVCDTNCRVGIQLLLVEENNKEFFSFIEKIKNWGIHFVEIRPAINIHGDVNEVDLADEETYFKSLEDMGNEHLKVIVRRERFRLRFGYGKNYNRCISPHFVSAFGADGNIYTCCELLGYKDNILGNFMENTLRDIFQFNRMEEKLLCLNLNSCPKYCKTDEINRAFNFLKNMEHYNIL